MIHTPCLETKMRGLMDSVTKTEEFSKYLENGQGRGCHLSAVILCERSEQFI